MSSAGTNRSRLWCFRLSGLVGALFATALLTSPAAAQTPPPKSTKLLPEQPDAEHLRKAKEFFLRGVELSKAGETQAALDYFLKSRAEHPSVSNTQNAAVCLDRLGRYDEALDMYGELRSAFGAQLDAGEKSSIDSAVAALEEKVGDIEISSNVDGRVIIGDRERRRLQQKSSFPVRGGKHLVRVQKDGYEPFETTIEVKVGTTSKIAARLRPLARRGQIRVEDPTNLGARVFIDGTPVGVVPWEGTAGLGRHVLWIAKGDSGSGPINTNILEDQIALLRIHSTPLGPAIRLEVSPASAEVSIDGALVGSGSWEGRLPIGQHHVTVREAGYQPTTQSFTVPEAGSVASRLRVRLSIDPRHQRWLGVPKDERWIEAFGGYALGPSLNGDAEKRCPRACSTAPLVSGFFTGLRGGYRSSMGLALELSAGYALLHTRFSRTDAWKFPTPPEQPVFTTTYHLNDTLQIDGPFVGLGLSYRVSLGRRLGLFGRTTAGLLFATTTDPISGTADTGHEVVPVTVQGVNESLRSTAASITPELGLETTMQHLRVGVSLACAIFLTDGPRFQHRSVNVRPSCSISNPGAVGCTPGFPVVANEQAYRAFVVLIPQVSAGYLF